MKAFNHLFLPLIATTVASSIFLMDVFLPLGVAGGGPYAAVVLLGWWFRGTKFIFLLAAIGTVLTVVGYLFSPEGGTPWVVLSNRALAIFAIWTIAVLVYLAKRAEVALRESEAMLRAFVDYSPSSCSIKDLQGRYTLTNRLEADGTEYFHKDALGKTAYDILPKETADLITASDKEVVETGQIVEREYEWEESDGVHTLLRVKCPISNYAGEVEAVGTIGTIITASKRAEAAVRDSEERFRAGFEHAAAGIMTVDRDRQYLSVNSAYCAMIGYSEEEILAMGPADINHPDDRVLDETSMGRLWDGEVESLRWEKRYFHRDGHIVWVDAIISIIRDSDGEPLYTMGQIHDVTERKRAEEALRDSEQRMRLVTDAMPALIAYINSTGRYHFANKRYEEWYGIKVEDVIGKFSKDVLGDKFYGQVAKRVEEVLSGREVTYEETFEYEDGKLRHFQATYVPHLGASGDVMGYYSLVTDITERKKAEEQLQIALRAAKEANQAKTQFLTSMSHELRTPLNSVLGFSQLLKSSKKETLNDKQRDHVDHILDGGEHLLYLINQVLALSQIEAGAADMFIEDVEVADVFEECLVLIEPLAERYGTSVIVGGTNHGTAIVRADYTCLKQVLLNLLSNAVKYNRTGGTVIVECTNRGRGMARLSVSDTGPGIPKDKQSELFKPFSRLGAELSNIEGTGVGLTLTKQLVELMGGRIGFESKEGKGSTFWIDIPRAKGKRRTKAAKKAPRTGRRLDARNKKHSLLYVEDNPSSLHLMEKIIALIPDLQMISAHTAELGLEPARKYQPDVILMDINLPGMNGIEAVKELKRSKKTDAIPVIAISANAGKSDIKKGMKAGFDNYLTKPIQVAELLSGIEAALNEGISRKSSGKGSKRSRRSAATG